MKLLLDESFPKHSTAMSKGDVEIRRTENSTLSDEDFIRAAATNGYHGVVFLGEEFVSRDELIELAADLNVMLIAVAQEDPESGLQYLSRNVSALRRELGASPAVIVWSSRIDREPALPVSHSDDVLPNPG